MFSEWFVLFIHILESGLKVIIWVTVTCFHRKIKLFTSNPTLDTEPCSTLIRILCNSQQKKYTILDSFTAWRCGICSRMFSTVPESYGKRDQTNEQFLSVLQVVKPQMETWRIRFSVTGCYQSCLRHIGLILLGGSEMFFVLKILH